MRHPQTFKARKHAHGVLPCFLLLLPLLAACRNDMEKIQFFEQKELPQQTLDSVCMFRSQEGTVDVIMTAPSVVIYDTPQKKTVYPKGVSMRIVDKRNPSPPSAPTTPIRWTRRKSSKRVKTL